jgi:hypothetical protein
MRWNIVVRALVALFALCFLGCSEAEFEHLAKEATIQALGKDLGTHTESVLIRKQTTGEGDAQHAYRHVEIQFKVKPSSPGNLSILRMSLQPGKTYSVTAIVLLQRTTDKWEAKYTSWEKISEL